MDGVEGEGGDRNFDCHCCVVRDPWVVAESTSRHDASLVVVEGGHAVVAALAEVARMVVGVAVVAEAGVAVAVVHVVVAAVVVLIVAVAMARGANIDC